MLPLRSKGTHGAEQSAVAPNPAFHTALRKAPTPVGTDSHDHLPKHQASTLVAFRAQRKKLKGYEDGLAVPVSLEI